MKPVTVEIHCRLNVVVHDPDAVIDLAVRRLHEAAIDWSSEEDDLETAAAELRNDLLNALAGLVDPERMVTGVPGVEVRGGHVWAQPDGAAEGMADRHGPGASRPGQAEQTPGRRPPA